jgi:CRP/FNR family cyclic AMP-dependent transcriptional regulator
MAGSFKKVLYFLGTLDDKDIEWMVRNGEKRTVATGTRIIQEGHPTEFLFFILAGEFAVTSERGKAEIARLSAGEILGEISFVDSRPPSATVTATADSVVGAIPEDALEKKLRQDLAFASRFYRSIAVALADRLRARNLLGIKSAPASSMDDDMEVPSHLLDTMSMAGMRFTEMQRRHWGP